MGTLTVAIAKLDELEPGLRSLDTLFALGVIVSKSEGRHQAGDWDLHIWVHDLEGFSVGAIKRVRQNGQPFPMVVHNQKKWILCSKGMIRVESEGETTLLMEGERMTIAPMVPHEIHPVTDEGIAVLVMVPADPGMKR